MDYLVAIRDSTNAKVRGTRRETRGRRVVLSIDRSIVGRSVSRPPVSSCRSISMIWRSPCTRAPSPSSSSVAPRRNNTHAFAQCSNVPTAEKTVSANVGLSSSSAADINRQLTAGSIRYRAMPPHLTITSRHDCYARERTATVPLSHCPSAHRHPRVAREISSSPGPRSNCPPRRRRESARHPDDGMARRRNRNGRNKTSRARDQGHRRAGPISRP